ncbi:hypothetical protein Efla_002319 [Eimeria flavescens]
MGPAAAAAEDGAAAAAAEGAEAAGAEAAAEEEALSSEARRTHTSTEEADSPHTAAPEASPSQSPPEAAAPAAATEEKEEAGEAAAAGAAAPAAESAGAAASAAAEEFESASDSWESDVSAEDSPPAAAAAETEAAGAAGAASSAAAPDANSAATAAAADSAANSRATNSGETAETAETAEAAEASELRAAEAAADSTAATAADTAAADVVADKAATPAAADAAAGEEGYEDLFGSGDEGQSEASLDSNADLFGDMSPSAADETAVAAAAAAAAAAGDSLEAAEVAAAAAAAAADLSREAEDEVSGREQEASKDAADSLPPQTVRLKEPWSFRAKEGSLFFTWKVPPAISIISAADNQQQQQQQRFAIKFTVDEAAAAEGKPALSSNCRLVQYSDDSYCLFVDDHGFECNTKEDVSYIFESSEAKEPLCSVFPTDRRLQVLIRAGVDFCCSSAHGSLTPLAAARWMQVTHHPRTCGGTHAENAEFLWCARSLGADSFFYNSKKAERLQHKKQTALTTTELVEAADLAHKQAFLTRQENARSRRAQAESQRGLTRVFLEAEDSDKEDEQGESLEKIKERFKRRRFL